MSDFIVALGLVLVIEGCAYALFPRGVRGLARWMADISNPTMRLGGLLFVTIGVIVVWLERG